MVIRSIPSNRKRENKMTKVEDRKTVQNCGCAAGGACRCNPCTCKNCNC